jgi:hypothetical protein
VKEFVYLGSMFTRDGKCDSDIDRRVIAGNMVNGALHAFMGYRVVSKEDLVTKIEKKMMRWFGHVERMDERRLSKEIYEVDVGGNAGRGILRRTFLDQIGEVLEKDQVRSTQNRRACMRNLMTVEEAKGL